MLEDTENWLYEDGEDQPKQVYEEKLDALKVGFDISQGSCLGPLLFSQHMLPLDTKVNVNSYADDSQLFIYTEPTNPGCLHSLGFIQTKSGDLLKVQVFSFIWVRPVCCGCGGLSRSWRNTTGCDEKSCNRLNFFTAAGCVTLWQPMM